jgi:hypothetical protein
MENTFVAPLSVRIISTSKILVGQAGVVKTRTGAIDR